MSEEAQEKAIEKWREDTIRNGDYHWLDEIIDSMKGLFEAIDGVRLIDWNIDSENRNNYIRFAFYSDDVVNLSGPRAQAWLENNLLYKLREHRVFQNRIYRYDHDGNKPHTYERHGQRKTAPFTGYCADEDFLKCLEDAIKSGETVCDALKGIGEKARELFAQEIEGQLSEEYIKDTILANDYEFTEDGRMA